MLIYYHKEIYTGRLIEVDLKELLVSLNNSYNARSCLCTGDSFQSSMTATEADRYLGSDISQAK